MFGRSDGGLAEGALEQMEELPLGEQTEAAFPSARMARAFSSLLLTVAVPPGPLYCRPTTRKSVFRETAVLMMAPH